MSEENPSTMRKIRIAIYGDVNLNIIDGSSVWVLNVARLSTATAHSEVHVYSKAPILRPELLGSLSSQSNARIIAPDKGQLGHAPMLTAADVAGRVASENLVDPYDVVIVRGMAAAEQFCSHGTLSQSLWIYLTDIPQSSIALDATTRGKVISIAERSRYLLCQTEELRNFLETRVGVSGRKLLLLPPLVQDDAFANRAPAAGDDQPLRLVYAGKFAPLWGLNEQLDAFDAIRNEGHAAEFHVVGDKFHADPDNPLYVDDLRARLRAPGVTWYGGVPQDQVSGIQEKCDIGMAFRSSKMNASLELSTKLLEYGASGLACIVNPTPMHRRILGDDYPLFADTPAQLKERLLALLASPEKLRIARERLRLLAEEHRMSRFQATWDRYLARMAYPPSLKTHGKKKHVLLAGHDLKFCKELIEYLRSRKDVELRIDEWHSLREHNEAESRKLLEWADTVVCEWCAGNAVWYSNNIDPRRHRLFVRFHRFEINSEFPAKVNLAHVEKMIFVGKHILDDAAARFGWDRERLALIPNFVDTLVYDRPKFPGAEFNLGLIGYVPMLKRLDRAIDILEALLEHDPRYMLFIKGRHPWEYPWIWRKPEEREHYETIFRRLRGRPGLRERVVFDGFGDDIPGWLRKIGFVLSTSDIESFHMAVAEGMASGARAAVLSREGVEDIFPAGVIAQDNAHAVDRVLAPAIDAASARTFIERYSFESVAREYDRTIFARPEGIRTVGDKT